MIGTPIKRSSYYQNIFFVGETKALPRKKINALNCANQNTNCSLNNKMILVIGWPAYLNSTSSYFLDVQLGFCSKRFNSIIIIHDLSIISRETTAAAAGKIFVVHPPPPNNGGRWVTSLNSSSPPFLKRTHNRSAKFTNL